MKLCHSLKYLVKQVLYVNAMYMHMYYSTLGQKCSLENQYSDK